MTVKIGDRAVYLPRVPYGRQSELFCFVSRVVDAERGIVDIITFPADGELQRINNVMPKADGIQVHCWMPREEDSRIAELEARIVALESGSAVFPSPEEIVRRGPGRPRKDAA